MTSEIFGKISASDLVAAMLRFPLSWGASLPDFAIASVDVTAAFLNAALPRNRVVVLRPPAILYKLQLIPPGHVWLVHEHSSHIIARKQLTSRSEGKVFSAPKTQLPQQAEKRFGVYQKACFRLSSRLTEGNYIYTKEPLRCLWGTPSCSIGV